MASDADANTRNLDPVADDGDGDWKAVVRQELASSLRALTGTGDLWEDFLFLTSLDAGARERFSRDARIALDAAPDAKAWEAFLAPYWDISTPPPRPAPAIAAVPRHDPYPISDEELDELILPFGAMVSARYPRLA